MKTKRIIKCGDANPNGNISMLFFGGCGKPVNLEEAYRCAGCGGYFHLDCIYEHFEKEEKHNDARNALRKLLKVIKTLPNNNEKQRLLKICKKGLDRKLKKRRIKI